MIPPFTTDGVLPLGRHIADVAEVEIRLVTAFADSLTRSDLYDGLRRRREELLDIVDVESEWVDGSFVTARRDPGDVDVVTFVGESDLQALEPTERERLSQLTGNAGGGGPHARLSFGGDCYLVASVPPGHVSHSRYVAVRDYWHRWWSRHNGVPDGKGYLDMRDTT